MIRKRHFADLWRHCAARPHSCKFGLILNSSENQAYLRYSSFLMQTIPMLSTDAQVRDLLYGATNVIALNNNSCRKHNRAQDDEITFRFVVSLHER